MRQKVVIRNYNIFLITVSIQSIPNKMNYIIFFNREDLFSVCGYQQQSLLDRLNDFFYINQVSKPMANHLNEFIQKLKLKQLDQNQNLYFVQKNLGVKPSSLFVALSVFILIVTLTSNTTSIVVNIVCSLIPAYFTFLTLQSKQSDDNIKYLTYWIIYALIETISPFLSLILTSFLYILLRIGLTIVLIHPSFNFTVKVYREYIEPEIKKYESSIDQRIQQGKSVAQNQYKKFTRN